MTNKIFTNCVHYRKDTTHCAKNLYQCDCRGCTFFKNIKTISEKYHIQVKLYKEVNTNKYKFIKSFDSHNFNEEVAEYLYNLITNVETEVYNNQKQNGKFEVYKGLLDYAEKRITELEKICTEDLASEVEHQALFNTVTDLEKRIGNLEKVYLMMYDEFDKKLEMLRENNNLFAEEIKKLGGFQEDDYDFEALDLSSVKELLEMKKRLNDGVAKVVENEMIYEEKVE